MRLRRLLETELPARRNPKCAAAPAAALLRPSNAEAASTPSGPRTVADAAGANSETSEARRRRPPEDGLANNPTSGAGGGPFAARTRSRRSNATSRRQCRWASNTRAAMVRVRSVRVRGAGHRRQLRRGTRYAAARGRDERLVHLGPSPGDALRPADGGGGSGGWRIPKARKLESSRGAARITLVASMPPPGRRRRREGVRARVAAPPSARRAGAG